MPNPTANLRAMFAPRAVAVIGASERVGSVGRAVFERLVARFAGDVFPVTPAHGSVFGRKAFSTIADVPKNADLAVIATPARTVPEIGRACALAGVKGAVVISAGFREAGAAGAELEAQLRDAIGDSGMRVIGPNCLGIIVPGSGLDATFASGAAIAGPTAFVSQSGALCTAILDWAATRGIGFSCFISTGTMMDVDWSDYIDLLIDDPRTSSILLYMESVGDRPATLLSSLRDAATKKPVIVMKSGRTEAAARAAASHTGALVGSDDVFDAALQRCGALRVATIEDLFDMADVLSKGKRPRGNRLAIVTNAGGPGVIASDALLEGGGELAVLSRETARVLDTALSGRWSGANPVDLFGDADPTRFGAAVGATLSDPATDAVLVIYAPTAVAPDIEVAKSVESAARGHEKPLLGAWMGGAGVARGIGVLLRAGVPTYTYPESAVRAFNYLWKYDENLKALYETPSLAGIDTHDRTAARRAIDSARAAGREWLSSDECAQVAAAYGVPLVRSAIANDGDEAVRAADAIGYPVAVKLRSSVLVHKTDIGGVRLDISDLTGVRAAFDAIRATATSVGGSAAFDGVVVQPMVQTRDGVELILGSALDKEFGPVIAFGLGGVLVEVLCDRAIGFPPLNVALARRLISSTKASFALGPIRGRRPVDVDALASLIVSFSDLVIENPEICEIDVNPLFASADRIVALDARMRLLDRAAQPPRPAPQRTSAVT
jgi:acetyltransferase